MDLDDILANLEDATQRRREAAETWARALFSKSDRDPKTWHHIPRLRAELDAAERAYAMAYTAKIEALAILGRRY